MLTVSPAPSLPAPLVVVYHRALSPAMREAWPEATLVADKLPGSKDLYSRFGSSDSGIANLDEVLASAALSPADVSMLVLVGFSEGTQGIRTQLMAGLSPAGILAVDGIHTRPEAWSAAIQRAKDRTAAATITHSSLLPGTYKSTTQIAAELAAPGQESPVSPEGQADLTYPMIGTFEDGFFRVVGYAGSDPAAHQWQADHVMPRELAILRSRLAPGIDTVEIEPYDGSESTGLTTGQKALLALAGVAVVWAGWQWYRRR